MANNLEQQTALLIPTLNGGALWQQAVEAISAQNFKPAKIIIADSMSEDNTIESATALNPEIISIERANFDHGGTRQIMADAANLPYLVFLTQDAILLAPDSLEKIVTALAENPKTGAVCGRQLPHDDATVMAQHARLFNYPATSHTSSKADIAKRGLKCAFLSNSFAAYRQEALNSIGGFPTRNIFGEDMIAAAKMLQNDWQIAYCAEATVKHSHNYTVKQEFQRAFDIGVMHSSNAWLLENFGKAEGEGKRFVLSETKYIAKHAPLQLPVMISMTMAKVLGYKLGLSHKRLNNRWCKRFSMHGKWWGDI